MTLEAVKTWLVKQLTTLVTKIKGEISKVEAKIPSAEELAKFFNTDPVYNSATKKIEFYHDSTKVAELDATPFIKDGMVNTVSVTDGKTDGANNGKKVLLITFNTDSGKEDIEIPLTDIFDPNDYVKMTDLATAQKNGLMSKEDYAKLAKFKDADNYVETSELTDIDEATWKTIMGETE